MGNRIERGQASQSVLKIQVTENIEFVLKELEACTRPENSLNPQPSYKTLFRLGLASFYERFCAEKTKLFRLTQTHYHNTLPELCIVHTIPELDEQKDRPLLIDGVIFISHQYFKNWLVAVDKDLYEKEILELILSSLNMNILSLAN